MNESYYETLQQGLRSISSSLPDVLEPGEQSAIMNKIDKICRLAALQISEIRAYENRYRTAQ